MMHPDDLTPTGHCLCGCGQVGQGYRHIKKKPPIEIDPDTACWEWRGYINGGTGYGNITRNGRSHSTHKWVYERLVGHVPVGLQLDHLCRNRACVNPEHLEPVTVAENVRRGAVPILNEEKVGELRLLAAAYDGPVSGFARDVAPIYGVTPSCISHAVAGWKWARIDVPPVRKPRTANVGPLGWYEKRPCCVECGTTERKHGAHGLCANCYARFLHRRKAAA